MARSKNGKRKRNGKRRGGPSARSVTSGKPSRPEGGVVAVRSRGELERYLEGPDPVMIDFWAPWCAPCQAMAPIFEEVARQCEADDGEEERAEKVRFLKVDTERLPEVAAAFGIRSIPTLAVVHGGEVIDSVVGLISPSGLHKLCRRARDRAAGRTLGQRIKSIFAA